jgi:hypothetical protein
MAEALLFQKPAPTTLCAGDTFLFFHPSSGHIAVLKFMELSKIR